MNSAWNRAVRAAGLLTALAAAAVAPAFAFEKVHEGVYRMDPENIDELLELEATPDMRVLILEETRPKATSEVHAKALRNWIENGGVLWVKGDAAESALLGLIAKEIRVDDFKFQKPTTGKQGGELLERGASDRLVIHDHPLTEGVNRLYVYPARKFDGTRGLKPVVEMTGKDGTHGVVIGTVDAGRGSIILDGTRQTEATLMFWKRGDFDKDNPHAVKNAEGEWESYDWEKLLENARSLGGRTGSPRTSG